MAKPKKKAPLGRPPIAAEDRKATLVRVLTTEAEHEELERAAKAASMSVSTWVRSAALEKARGGGKAEAADSPPPRPS